MVIDSFQKRVVRIYSSDTFFQSQAFLTEKSQILSGFFSFQKKPKAFKKSQNFKKAKLAILQQRILILLFSPMPLFGNFIFDNNWLL